MNKTFHKNALNIVLNDRSKYLRKLAVKTLESGKRAHLGSAMSIMEIIIALYDNIMNINSKNFKDLNRDRFILSKGHGCLALYVMLADKKFFPPEFLLKFCHFDSILGGHPEFKKIPGVEASTGALGHGLPIAVGMAISAKIHKRKNQVYVLLGDGEINEGSIWESALSASKHQLSNLTVLIDYNKIQSYGFVKDVINLEPLRFKWESFGFEVDEVNGHDVSQILKSINNKKKLKPRVIICHTIKGKGFSFAEDNPKWHHKSQLTEEEIDAMYLSIK
ncbi:transketolase [Alphaproteobacteria bacterium]|nr:transketolase [Alphaproteobacteria bacterium]